jgi:hypothetical protein
MQSGRRRSKKRLALKTLNRTQEIFVEALRLV